MTADALDEQMIALGPGDVTLTDRRTQCSWTVQVAPYLLAAVPVTQAQYADVTGQPRAATTCRSNASRGSRPSGTAMRCHGGRR
jgi:formylglycine-generating enzyme required for sulfatase activity